MLIEKIIKEDPSENLQTPKKWERLPKALNLEDGAFIGSDTQLVAPVKVGKGAYIGAGSTITKCVPPMSLSVSRAEQRNIEGWARKKFKVHPDLFGTKFKVKDRKLKVKGENLEFRMRR
ncbi:hypothetical protein B9J78_06455 [bacterium Unc6]|nr:hypothetical protein [bacterium Unc6]